MSLTAPQTRIDPLHVFIAGGFVAGTPRPVPLVATRFDVLIDGGLAVVTTSRTFRNAESESIEATITFPVRVHATLFALKARIGDRPPLAKGRNIMADSRKLACGIPETTFIRLWNVSPLGRRSHNEAELVLKPSPSSAPNPAKCGANRAGEYHQA